MANRVFVALYIGWRIVLTILGAVMIGLVFAGVVLYSFCVPFKDSHMAGDGVSETHG